MRISKLFRPRSLAVLLLLLVLTTTAYAFAAANTVDESGAGDGDGTISGYDVTNISYDLTSVDSDPSTIDKVTFDVSPKSSNGNADTVYAQVSDGSGSSSDQVACTNTAGTTWECDFANSAGGSFSVAAAGSLNVIASE